MRKLDPAWKKCDETQNHYERRTKVFTIIFIPLHLRLGIRLRASYSRPTR